MMIFYKTQKAFIVGINYKVMFMSFQKLVDLGCVERLVDTQPVAYNLTNLDERIQSEIALNPIVIVARDPFLRLLSFYKDKFVRTWDEDANAQNLMKERIGKSKLTWEEYQQALIDGYMNSHIHLQSQGMNQIDDYVIVHLENPCELNFLEEIVGFKIPKENCSNDHSDYPISLDFQKWVVETYAEDYKIFRYEHK